MLQYTVQRNAVWFVTIDTYRHIYRLFTLSAHICHMSKQNPWRLPMSNDVEVTGLVVDEHDIQLGGLHVHRLSCKFLPRFGAETFELQLFTWFGSTPQSISFMGGLWTIVDLRSGNFGWVSDLRISILTTCWICAQNARSQLWLVFSTSLKNITSSTNHPQIFGKITITKTTY